MKCLRTTLFLLAAAILFTGCQTFPRYKVHHTLLEEQRVRLPSKTLLMPLDIRVMEMSTSGMQEEVPEWTAQAKAHMRTALVNNPHHYGNLTIIPLPATTPEQQQQVEQHTALYQTVSSNALQRTQNPTTGWRHKARRFDYTLGDGLTFLAEQTGADSALFINGKDVITTGGRKAAVFLAAALGVHMPLGHTAVIGSLVDLRTGNILWLNFDINTDGTTLIEKEDSTAVLNKLFEGYPGLEVYRKLNTTY